MLDFSFYKPVQRQDFLDQLPQSWQHRQWQNRTAGELLSGTTWTLEMRDDVSNSIYIYIYIAWQLHKSLLCETFYTLCFIVFFSSLCQTLKHSSLLSPNLSGCASILWRSSTLLSITSLGTVPYDPWFVNTARMLKIIVHSRFPYCVLYHISWNTVSGVGQ